MIERSSGAFLHVNLVAHRRIRQRPAYTERTRSEVFQSFLYIARHALRTHGPLIKVSMAMVRAAGLEPARACAQRIFVPAATFIATSFAETGQGRVCGLDYPFTLASRLRRRPSSLYTFPLLGLARDCHFTGFPESGQFYILGFPREHSNV
jgi:hypothetical protein